MAALYAVRDRLAARHASQDPLSADSDPEKADTQEIPRAREQADEGEGPDTVDDREEDVEEEDIEDIDPVTTFASTRASWWRKLKATLFSPYDVSSSLNLDQYVPNYRSTPILAGIVIPFSILLEIPGLTDHWYIRTVNHQIVDYRPNPAILDAGLAISMACGVFANVSLIMRFLEKRVKSMTILCVLFLTIHDIINVIAVTYFGVAHRYDDGFTYGQAFWLTVCSTIASLVTNVTLVVDLIRTKNFAKSGSGLTAKQRALVLIVMVLLLQIALGSAVNSTLLHLEFINGLYFTVASIETIGFGDIVPTSTGARVWVCAFSTIGIINLAVAVGMARDTVVEGMEVSYRKRVSQLRAFRRSEREKRKGTIRWKEAVERKLNELEVEVWIPDEDHPGTRTPQGNTLLLSKVPAQLKRVYGFLDLIYGHVHRQRGFDSTHSYGHHGYRLNIDALTPAELEACALEAAVPLDTVLPESHRARLAQAKFLTSWYGYWHPPRFMSSFGARKLLGTSRKPEGGQALSTNASQQSFGPDYSRGAAVKDRGPHRRTYMQIGQMAELMTRLSLGVLGPHFLGRSPEDHAEEAREAEKERASLKVGDAHHGDVLTAPRSDSLQPSEKEASGVESAKRKAIDASKMHNWRTLEEHSIGGTYDSFKSTLKNEEKRAFAVKLLMVWTLFFIFWMVGSVIFSRTEHWSFGTAMYFSSTGFIAFLTIGYGDYAPVTPTGRAIFVVWALLGVATMTILISVISDAYGSRYKSATSTQVYSKVVKQYWDRTRREPGPRPALESTPSGQHTGPRLATLEESHARVQQQLEDLPKKILEHARTFHEDIQYFMNTKARDVIASEYAAGGASAEVQPPAGLEKLLDDIAAAEGIGERVKKHILRDDEARNTLFMLSIEKSLREMIGAAEGALQALAERDLLAASQNHVGNADLREQHGDIEEVPR